MVLEYFDQNLSIICNLLVFFPRPLEAGGEVVGVYVDDHPR